MPAPATSPQFATDANFAADGDSWSGSPTKLDPGVGRRAEGFEPDTLPAEWLNYMINLHGEWIKWHEDELLGSATRTIRLSPFIGEGLLASVPLTSAAPAVPIDPWGIQVFGTGSNQGFNLVSQIDFASRLIDLTHIFHDITAPLTFKALVKPGAARSAGNQISLQWFLASMDFTTPGANFFLNGTPVEGALNTNDQVITLNLSGVVAKTSIERFFVKVTAGNDAGTHNPDRIYGYEISYSGPKVR